VGRSVQRARRGPVARGALLGLALAGAVPAAAPAQIGQVVRDGSIGAAPAGPVPWDPVQRTFLITDDLGEFSPGGSNLFHSFSFFDVGFDTVAGVAERASFRSLATPDRVIARVIGGEPSQIDGRIESLIPGADLFLINPSGIVFSETSELRLDGSLFASTAGQLHFADGTAFSTATAARPAVLSAAEPAAFGFLVDEPAAITIRRTDNPDPLRVPDGESLTFVAGGIAVEGVDSFFAPALDVDGGTVALAAVGSGSAATPVVVPVDVASFDASGFAPDQLGEVVLTDSTVIDAGNGSASTSRIVVRGGRFAMDGGFLQVTNESTSPGAEMAIDVQVAGMTVGGAVEGVRLEAGAALVTASLGPAPAGGIALAGPAIEITGPSVVATAALGSVGGDIELRGGRIRVSDSAQVVAEVAAGADAAGGTIQLDAGAAGVVEVASAGQVLSVTSGAGPSGPVEVDTGTLRVEGAGSQIATTALSGSSGAAGAVEIDAAVSVAVADQSQIASETFGSGPGGPVSIRTPSLAVDGRAQVLTRAAGAGDGGAIDIETTGAVTVTGLGKILAVADPDATGRGGDVEIDAATVSVASLDTPLADASQIGALTRGAAPGGSLTVRAGAIELLEGGQLRTTTSGAGSAGDIQLLGRAGSRLDSVQVAGVADAGGELVAAGIFARSLASGEAGDITIDARSLLAENGAAISTRSLGDARAGDLRIQNAEQVVIRGGPDGFTEVGATGAAGGGGNVIVLSDSLQLIDGGILTASTVGAGEAGDVRIVADSVLVSGELGLNRSGIFADSLFPGAGGVGGGVEITATTLRVQDGAEIAARGFGAGSSGGDVRIQTSKSVVVMDGGGIRATGELGADAGSIDIDAGETFAAVRNSPLPDARGAVATEALSGSGGTVSIRASELVYISDSRIETNVQQGGGDGGDFGTPVLPDQIGGGPRPARLVVLNRSRVVASAQDGDGGSILIDGVFLPSDVLRFDEDLASRADSVLDATSETATPGEIVITSPASALAGQLVPLPSSPLDATRMMLPPCAARTARTGSLLVEPRELRAPPDAPLAVAGSEPADDACPEAAGP
jgi:filamentous hemagglutinin family protein